MAGTRLLIEAVNLASFVVLVIAALYFGLSEQDIKALTLANLCKYASIACNAPNLEPIKEKVELLRARPVRIGTCELKEFMEGWLRSVYSQYKFSLHGTSCAAECNPWGPTKSNDLDLMLCWSRTLNQLSIRRSIATFFYTEEFRQLNLVLPHKTINTPPQITLLIDKTTLYKHENDVIDWKRTISRHITNRTNMPCFAGLKVQLKFVDLIGHYKQDTADNSTFIHSQHIDLEWRNAETDLNILLYLSPVNPLYISSTSGSYNTIVTSQDTMFMSLSVNNVDTNLLEQTLDWVLTKCMGIPSSTDINIDSDGSLPQLYVKLWLQKYIHQNKQTIVNKLNTLQSQMQNTYLTEAAKSLASKYNTDIVQHLNKASRCIEKSEISCVVKSLDQVQNALDSWNLIPIFLSPVKRIPMEQHAAVFGPLLLPLALPFLVGTIREYKRYKKHQKQKTM